MTNTSRIEAMKASIARIEGRGTEIEVDRPRPETRWNTGLPELDRALPDQTLLNGLHDIAPDRLASAASATLFALFLVQRIPSTGPVVWVSMNSDIREHGRPYGPGLLASGIDPARLVFVCVPKKRDYGFAIEESLRTTMMAAVVAEGPALAFADTRRITLRAQRAGVPCVAVDTEASGASSSAVTRWRVRPALGPSDPFDDRSPGASAWSVELLRARNADTALNPTLTHPLKVTWNGTTHRFDLVPDVRRGARRARPEPGDAVQLGHHGAHARPAAALAAPVGP